MKSQKESIRSTDWDCLVVFDSCRTDVYSEMTRRETETRKSPSTATPPWIDEVWMDEEREDVTYISGHPITDSEQFMYGDLDEYVDYVPAHRDAWDELIGATRPGKVTEAARGAEPPVVVHYLQPHTPFIGDLSIKAERCIEGQHRGHTHTSIPSGDEYEPDMAIYRMIMDGQLSEEAVRDAYEDNVRLVLQERQKIQEMFDSIVFTADHGESLGEGGRWGHWIDNDAVKEVPWDVV